MIEQQNDKALTDYENALHNQNLHTNVFLEENDRPSLNMVDERDPSER